MENNNEKAPVGLRSASAIGGVVALVCGVLGVVQVSRILANDFAAIEGGVQAYLTTFVVYHGMWWLFFVSLTIVGLSLLQASVVGRRTNLVPGPTLYVLGATLIINGLFLAMFSEVLWAISAIVVGLVLMYFENQTAIA